MHTPNYPCVRKFLNTYVIRDVVIVRPTFDSKGKHVGDTPDCITIRVFGPHKPVHPPIDPVQWRRAKSLKKARLALVAKRAANHKAALNH